MVYAQLYIQVNITGAAMMGTVTGLSPFTDYSCTIFAVTVTNGPVSDPVIVRTAEAGIVVNHVQVYCVLTIYFQYSSQSSSDQYSY